MLDKLSAIDDENARQDWLYKFGFKGISPTSTEHAKIFCKSRKYMLHAPVLKRDPESGVVSIVPLTPFRLSIPIGITLKFKNFSMTC